MLMDLTGDILVLLKKFEIVKEVLVGKVPVSEVCKKYNIDTRQYYTWQKKFLEGAYESFKNGINKRSRKEKLKEAEIDRMKNVIATLAEENLILKKNLGELQDTMLRIKNLKK